jgi:hypothetical protein
MAGIENLSAVISGASGGSKMIWLSECFHFSRAARGFSSTDQLSITLICVAAPSLASAGLNIRKRWPSGETSRGGVHFFFSSVSQFTTRASGA